MERLQKVIAQSGLCSRRKAEQLIVEGKVKVNNQVVTELGTKVNFDDYITVDNKKLKRERKEYYLLYKPKSIISSTTDDRDRLTVVDLITTSTSRLYPVGRLDYDTTGAIILTNDGEFANLMMHPSSNLKKVYLAYVDGVITTEQKIQLEQGVILDGRKTAKAKVKVLERDSKHQKSKVRITISEGRNHQVKDMFESVGLPVKRLHREAYGSLNLSGLEPGVYRKINQEELENLKALVNKK